MNINEFQEWFESTFWEYSAKFNGDVARIPAEQGFAKAAWKAACELKDKDLKKLGEVINSANAQTERFEREWYLRGDEIEALRAELDAFKAENIALRKVWGERCEELVQEARKPVTPNAKERDDAINDCMEELNAVEGGGHYAQVIEIWRDKKWLT